MRRLSGTDRVGRVLQAVCGYTACCMTDIFTFGKGDLPLLVSIPHDGRALMPGQQFDMTDAGKAIREQSELLTDRYFYAPWTTLNRAETEELRTLLTKLKKETFSS